MKKVYLFLTLIFTALGLMLFSVWYLGRPGEESKKESSLSRIERLKVLEVGSDLSLLPWADVDPQTGEPIGGEVELARLVGKKLKVEVEFVNRSWDYIIEDLLNKRFDVIMAGMSITEERKKRVDFSDPYFTIGQVLTVRKDSGIQSVADLAGKVVGVMAATTSEAYAKSLPGVAEVLTYESVDTASMYPDVSSGRVDAVIFDSVASYWHVRSHPESNLEVLPQPLTVEDYGMALRKEDQELKEALNKAILEAKEDPEYQQIIDRWYVLSSR